MNGNNIRKRKTLGLLSFLQWCGFYQLLSVVPSEIFAAQKSIIRSFDDYRLLIKDNLELKEGLRIRREKKSC